MSIALKLKGLGWHCVHPVLLNGCILAPRFKVNLPNHTTTQLIPYAMMQVLPPSNMSNFITRACFRRDAYIGTHFLCKILCLVCL